MSFWSGKELLVSLSENSIIVPFSSEKIDCASYTLALGAEAYVTPEYKIDTPTNHKKLKLDVGEQIIVPPGQFAFLLTEEKIVMPKDVIAFISLKSTYKWKGLINVSGFHVDPGFEGNLVYAVYNAGTQAIALDRGDEMFLIWFCSLSNLDDEKKASEYFDPKFVDYKNGPVLEKIRSNLITDMTGHILSLQSIQKMVEDQEKKQQQKFNEIDRTLNHVRIILWAAGSFLIAGITITAVVLQIVEMIS